jgi:hypothetical protein
MKKEGNSTDHLNKEATVQLILDFFHRLIMHHAFWYAEVKHHLGAGKANEILKDVYELSLRLQIKKLAKTLGFEMKDDLPVPLLELPPENLIKLKETIAANWLANDGIWFQSLEFSRGMEDAKKCNDSCWAQFSPLEAWSIRRFLNLSEKPGLEGLKKALDFRLYAAINRQSIIDETDNSFVFRMNDCRVQSARNRKGLPDYPCKSAGIVEYSTFARSIDSRIKTECISCPPDKHPNDWYCSWRFIYD